jgi:hypothetical protein
MFPVKSLLLNASGSGRSNLNWSWMVMLSALAAVHGISSAGIVARPSGWAEKLALCRRLWAAPCSDLLPQPAACRAYQAVLLASNPRLCPRCGVGILIAIQTLWPCHGPVPLRLDSS